MGKGVNPDLFVNDGSFMEKFKQLQQDKHEKEFAEEAKSGTGSNSVLSVKPIVVANKRPLEIKSSDMKKPSLSGSGGKLAFSLKQKSKIVSAPVKLAEDEEEDGGESEAGISEDSAKRQKLGQLGDSKSKPDNGDAPVPPSDPTVKNAADKLATFVAKNGRYFEDVTRQKNPGDTPFKFLFDTSCSDYKYYEYQLLEEEKIQRKSNDSQHESSGAAASSKASNTSQRRASVQKNSNFQTPVSALYGVDEDIKTYAASMGKPSIHGESSGPASSDPIAVMEYYMKKAAQEERKRQPRYSKDEMPPPASLQASSRKGHHMGDFIPQEELDKFFASCNDATAQKIALENAAKSRIQSDNVGHKLLSKMGWKEGEGLGSAKAGRADPVMAGSVKLNNLGVGAENPGEVTPEDDIYEQYKKRMMLGYKYRPNPLNNPRKAYY
ncbi:SURP and G-patch domain-containing protein 1-like protein isoform X2 [Phalaenopsis equestris]|uniref:SURP and G-patch domain-containing protein 1-like protein isoform X2 n=1 Tax=Phalaenopsis equestris TaxID=78828 RepID=UPI0009E3EF21|nr:SURP and G-patch domain-containing protein 1-like protein isoform X2 [Phalaenopsis equestris]